MNRLGWGSSSLHANRKKYLILLTTQKQEANLSLPAISKTTNYKGADATLIEACLEGNETAWKELVERYGRPVYSIPLRHGLSLTDADDVFQNVFTIAYRRLESLRKQTSLSAWLITITQRESLRLHKPHQSDEELDEQLEDENTPPTEHIQRWERQHIVHQALAQLDPRCRKLLFALFLESKCTTYEKLAKWLRVPVGTVGPTRARCFKKLEVILSSLGVDGAF